MAYSLNKIYSKFYKCIIDINEIISDLSKESESLKRDVFIEGCYIRFVVSWENFVEEFFLRTLCVSKTRSGKMLKPKVVPFRNINDAFVRINKNRRERLKDYIDWLDAKEMQIKIDDYFRSNSRVQKICASPEKLYEMSIIRNAIAHQSKSAINKFEKHVKSQMGYLSSLNPTMANLLIQKKRNTSEIIFTQLSSHFVQLADYLTK